MKTIIKYFKNSNTGVLIMQQSFTDTRIKFDTNYYDRERKHIGTNYSLTGFVEISKKKFDRERKTKTHEIAI